jgi:hypothetical protein
MSRTLRQSANRFATRYFLNNINNELAVMISQPGKDGATDKTPATLPSANGPDLARRLIDLTQNDQK